MLLLYANGMRSADIGRTMFLSSTTVDSYRKRALVKLGCTNITAAVAKAWRECLIEADEIEGGAIDSFRWMTRDEVTMALLSYRERTRHLPPPVESFAELRARCALLAADYRDPRRRRTSTSSKTSQISSLLTRSSTAPVGRSLPKAGRHGPVPARSRSTPKVAT